LYAISSYNSGLIMQGGDMKSSDLLLKCLQLHDIKTIYGVPGEENADLMISLLDSPIEFITTRHEQTAAFMATMHGALTENCGVCMSTLGPGATNLLTGVAQANMDHAPLLAIIGQAQTFRLHKESHQNMNSVEMYRSVTKWATTITDPDTIPEVIAKAIKIATTGRPGAVLVELPEDIAALHTDAKPFALKSGPASSGATDAQLQALTSILENSQKPLVLLGDGANSIRCHQALKTFFDNTQYYAAYTFMSKGSIHHDYVRSLHCVGLGFNDLVINAFKEADCVICIGYHMVEYPPARWHVGEDKKIVHIDIAPAEVDQSYLPDLALIGDIGEIVQEINAKLTDGCRKETAYFQEQQKNIEADLDKDRDDDSFPMKPKRILRDIRATLNDEDILVSDVGAHKMWVARQYGARLPKTVFISNGFCSMSGSLPGALEAKRLYPEKNVVAVCGDGGFMMGIQALVTGVEYQIPFVAIVWQDDYYGLIKWKQEIEFKRTSHVALHNPDLAELSRAYGCYGEHVVSADELKNQLSSALSRKDKPTILVVPVDYSENMKLVEHLKEMV
jgi:acetolactate synthase I/II/III large subunit